MGSQEVSHCFPLNGNQENPATRGLKNVIEDYQVNSHAVHLSGPTLIAPILKTIYNSLAESSQIYKVVILLLDGEIDDYKETKAILVRLSSMPCSVIIIGIGSARFMHLPELTNPNLRDTANNLCKRSMVQFMRFLECVAQDGFARLLSQVPE